MQNTYFAGDFVKIIRNGSDKGKIVKILYVAKLADRTEFLVQYRPYRTEDGGGDIEILQENDIGNALT